MNVRLPKIISIWPSEWENPNGSPATARPPSLLRKQESRIWAPDQVRGDGFIVSNRTKLLAISITVTIILLGLQGRYTSIMVEAVPRSARDSPAFHSISRVPACAGTTAMEGTNDWDAACLHQTTALTVPRSDGRYFLRSA
jgi:hypothetical protein